MKAVTVTQLTEYISRRLSEDVNLRKLVVEGEISGLSFSGPHAYLTLKDEKSSIRCAIWGSYLKSIDKSLLENGKNIIAYGEISPYARNGSYSLSIKLIEDAGEGKLMAEFNRIRKLLEDEGLFDNKYKKPLPEFPSLIGVVTSDTGAAIEDIKKIILGKNDYASILIFPTIVQGDNAPASIISNIELANSVSRSGRKIDVLIVGRGGGSAEDLAAFNDEGVARAIFGSEIPVISAVGHQSDTSISDFVADVRAETPTAAADMAVPNTDDLRNDIEYFKDGLLTAMQNKLMAERQYLDNRRDLLYSNMRGKIAETRIVLEKAKVMLRENDPRNILEKGYAIVSDENGKFISDIGSVEVGNTYNVTLKDGTFKAAVSDKEGK